jgi:carboxymethylenebutenolidase
MRITLPSGTPAELAEPEDAPSRGLVIAPDIMGLRPLFDDLAASLAAEHGWAVCVVEPFPAKGDMPLEIRLESGVGALHDLDVLGDLSAAADHLDLDRVAVLGFCMGGMYALKAAGLGVFDRAVSFYGMIRVPERWAGEGHDQPLDYLARPVTSRTLAIIGGRDQWTPPDDVEALRANPKVEVVIYPEAEHGFVHDATRPAHRATDAADAWSRVATFLA